MNWRRAWAVTVRHLYNFKHSIDRLSDGIYWPAIDIIIWGLTSQYLQSSSNQFPHIALIFLTALIFWQTVWRTQHDITISFLDELWNKNLLNLFSSPVTLKEWIAGVIMLGLIKIAGTTVFTFALVWLLYAIKIASLGLNLIPFFINLLLVGWWLGLLTSAAILLYGTRIQTVAWASAALLAPFSAIYYPIASLPGWARAIAHLLPTSYMFEGMRQLVNQQAFPWEKLVIGLILNLLYLGLAINVFSYCFKKSQDKGLARLE